MVETNAAPDATVPMGTVWPYSEVQCTPDEAARANHLLRIIRDRGFHIVHLPVVDFSVRVQLQRGNRIYDRWEYTPGRELVQPRGIDRNLAMLTRFAEVAEQEAYPPDPPEEQA